MKVDLYKVYGSVEWVVIDQIMRGLSFSVEFFEWIMVCIISVSYIINVNGEQTAVLRGIRGFR